jgi:hypothetical protein
VSAARRTVAIAAIVLSLASPACGLIGPSGPLAEEQARLTQARARWRALGLADYSYVFRRVCYCTPDYIAPVRITVRTRLIASVETVEGGIVRAATSYSTIEELFDLVQAAIDKNAAALRTEYDPARGHLTSAYIDLVERIADDELSIEVSALTVPR